MRALIWKGVLERTQSLVIAGCKVEMQTGCCKERTSKQNGVCVAGFLDA